AVHVAPSLKAYIVDLADATRRHPDLGLGVSPRAALGLQRAARSQAASVSRDYVVPDDIKALAGPVLEHRLALTPEAQMRSVARGTPVVTIRDPFDRGRRQARFLVPPLRRGEAARGAYRLPTERRGVFPIGPMSATVADPFGLAARTRRIATETELTVYPRVDPIVALPQTIGHDPHAGAD